MHEIYNNGFKQEEINSAKFALKSAKYNLTLPIYESLSLKQEPPRIESSDTDNFQTGDDTKSESSAVQDPKGLSSGVIAAIVVGAAVVIGVAGVSIACLCKKKKL